MKKFFQIAALALGLLVTQNGYSQDNTAEQAVQPNYGSEQAAASGECCPPDCAADKPLNDCWCLYVHYKPCYYNDYKCCEEQVPYKERCCRQVPKYYQVQKCRYVPQYYCETCCRYEPEYYEVDKCRTCQKWVCDQKCRYVPQYYWKHTCGNPQCTTACPAR